MVTGRSWTAALMVHSLPLLRLLPARDARSICMTEEIKTWDAGTKSSVVIQLLRNERTAQELAIAYGLEVEQILTWKKQVIDKVPTILAENDYRKQPKRGKKS
jgi:hypothetical protein